MRKRIEYIVYLLVLIMAYIWTNQKLTMWIMIFSVGAIALIIIINQFILRKISITCDVVQNNGDANGSIKITINNNGFLPANHIETVISCYNVVFGSREERKIELSVGGKVTRYLEYQLVADIVDE